MAFSAADVAARAATVSFLETTRAFSSSFTPRNLASHSAAMRSIAATPSAWRMPDGGVYGSDARVVSRKKVWAIFA
jgi:hypothetical protein